jgi:hypothetical protein
MQKIDIKVYHDPFIDALERSWSREGSARIAQKRRGRPVKNLPPDRAALYGKLRNEHPEIAPKNLKALCQYKPGHAPTSGAQARALSIDAERERLQLAGVYTFEKATKALTAIIDSGKAHDADAIKAVQVGNAMYGFDAPRQVNMTSRNLFVELQGLTIAQLQELIDISDNVE